MSVKVVLSAIQITPRQVEVPDACPGCGNEFTHPGKSSLLLTRINSVGYWSFVESHPLTGKPRVALGERHSSDDVDDGWRVALSCQECGYQLAAPEITGAAL